MSSLQKIDAKSGAACHNAFELFTVLPTNVSINRSAYVEILPQSTLTQEGPIEFRVFSDNRWIDPTEVYTHLLLAIERKEGAEWKPTQLKTFAGVDKDKDISVIQSIGYSLFETVKVNVQNVEISSQAHYPYLCYLKNALSYTEEQRSTLLAASGYFTDGKHDDKADWGFKKRAKIFEDGKMGEFMTRVEFDLANQERFLLNNMEVLFQFHKADDKFLVHAPDVTDENLYRVRIHDMRLWVKLVDAQPSVNVGVLSMLERASARYCLRKSEVRTYFLTEGRTESAHNIFSSVRPRRMCIGLVANDAYVGTVKKSPFNFQRFDIREVGVECAGFNYPATRYDLRFDTKNPSFMRAFVDLHNALNIRTCGITVDKFWSGWTLFVIPLTPLLDDNADGFELIQQTTTTLKLAFHKPIPKGGVMVVCMAEFDQLLSIDQNRVIISDGAPA